MPDLKEMHDFTGLTPITFNQVLPKNVDVVIVGGGIVGVTTAWHLLQRGKSVVICEKGRIACEQSSRNWGWIRVTGRDPDEVPIALESVEWWKHLDQSIEEDFGFRENQGVLALTENERELADFNEWIELAKQFGINTEFISKDKIEDFVLGTSGKWKGGIVTPSDARAEPFLAVPAIAKEVQRMGGYIKENCAVRAIETQGGCVTEVVTEHGAIRTEAAICAAGAWSSLLLSNLGVRFPQLAVQGTVARTAPSASAYEGAAGLQDVFIRRRLDGGYTVATGLTSHIIGPSSFRQAFQFLPALTRASELRVKLGRDPTQRPVFSGTWSADSTTPFEQHRVLNPSAESVALKNIRTRFDKRLPDLSGTPFLQSWSGMIDATPDLVPVIDQIDDYSGLFLASGFSGHGFGIGPGAGRVMADLVCGRSPGHDLNRFRFSRFSDGSRIQPGPAI